MTTLGSQTITDDAPQDNPGHVIATLVPADTASVADVLAADPGSDGGRSEWLWITLPNGDVILGVFPQGDTYLAHETEYA